MSYADIINRLTFAIPTGKKMAEVDFDEFGLPIIKLDLHEYHKTEAKKAIKNILLLLRFEFTLEVIHGYNNGTVLLEYVRGELKHERILNRYGYPSNPGATYFELSA